MSPRIKEIEIEGIAKPIKVVKKLGRRSISLLIDHGKLEVRAPFLTDDGTIIRWVKSKSSWIQKKLSQIPEYREHKYIDGELFYYLGSQYPLRFDENVKNDRRITAKLSPENRGVFIANNKTQLQKLYRYLARNYLAKRLKELSKYTNIPYEKMRLSSAHTRWGSCSSNGTISLNWKLIMAPAGIIDYVIIHELCHVRHMNHSKLFWQLVTHYLPDCKERRKWLRQNSNKLVF
ncbi:MAG TPA: SprT family zinc-dependent metalloprotease [Candidatus Dojkabacteria bacterium]|nr:SprT family zinc-dependent metalloprotease [Candidatus Dojkabacteria bacterium]